MSENSDQLFRSALNSLSQPICICDKGGMVLFMNSGARSLTGWDEEGGSVDISNRPGKMEIGGRWFPCTLKNLYDGDDSFFRSSMSTALGYHCLRYIVEY